MKRYLVRVKDFFVYDCRYGIKNLIQWFPLVWQNRDYDHYFIYTALRHKLDLTEKHIREHDIHTRAKEDADRIKTCVLLLDRLIEDVYHEMAFKEHDKRWGRPELNWEDIDEPEDCVELHITHKHVHTKEDKEKETKDFRRASTHEANLRKQDRELLFNTLKKHIDSWWD